MNSFKTFLNFKKKFIYISIVYYDIFHMSSEIIQSVIIAYDNYDGFQHVNFIFFFTKFHFISLF
jgi:hypothetical protein